MPIEVGIWGLGDKIERVDFSPMEADSGLEDIPAADLSILDPNLLLIGRQVPTPSASSSISLPWMPRKLPEQSSCSG